MRANEAIEKFFQGDTLLFDMFFAHDGGVKTACGDEPTEKAKKMCVSVMKVLLTSIKFRCAMRCAISLFTVWMHPSGSMKSSSMVRQLEMSRSLKLMCQLLCIKDI